MIAKRIFGSLLIAALMATQVMVAYAQSGRSDRLQKRGWAGIAMNGRTAQPVEADASDRGDSIELLAVKPQAEGNAKLVGTWVMHVPAADGAPAFDALHTYTNDGTMTETSDLLGQLNEGPAHGVWSGKKNDYLVTFELFVFDENQQPAGRVRVRCAFHLSGEDQLTAQAFVDFIEPDGNVIPNIGATPFTGKRMKVQPVP